MNELDILSALDHYNWDNVDARVRDHVKGAAQGIVAAIGLLSADATPADVARVLAEQIEDQMLRIEAVSGMAEENKRMRQVREKMIADALPPCAVPVVRDRRHAPVSGVRERTGRAVADGGEHCRGDAEGVVNRRFRRQ